MSEPNGYTNVAYESPPEIRNGKPVEVDGPKEDLPPDVAIPTDEKEKEESSSKKEKPKIVSLSQLFRFADRVDYILMSCGIFCACAHGVAMPALLLIFGSLADDFVGFANKFAGNETLTEEDKRYFTDEIIRPKCVQFVGVGIGVLFVAYGQVMFWLTTSHRQSHRIRIMLLRSVLRQEIGWFDTNDVGTIGIKLTDDVNKIQAGIGDKIGAFFQFLATFIVGIIIALVKGWKLALVILSTTPLLAGCGAVMMILLTSSTKKESEAYAKAGAVAEEDLSAIRTVVVFGGEEKECQRYNSNLVAAKAFGIRKNIVNGAGMGISYLVIFCTYALAFWYGGTLTVPKQIDPNHPPSPEDIICGTLVRGDYTIGQLLIVFFCAVFGAMALGNASPNVEFIATARGSAYAIWSIIDRVSEIDSMSEEGLRPSSLTGNIELVDVKFHYPSRSEIQILNGLSVKIHCGQTVALVGSSGCGKSTVIQLIQRFYDPLEGAVTIDGTDVRQLNIQWLRQHVGVVSQEPVLFALTIGENIRYGRDGVTQEEIEKAAQEANAHDFISKLPLKYETLVGERGAQLSGGQKQRIAIARALVRNPRILLLDEATSALDTESEATVQAALDKARQGRTTVVVAHRLSTIKTADIIYGLKGGVAHECGTHEELMEMQGIYYQLVMNQQFAKESDDEEGEDEDEGIEAFGTEMSPAASRASLKRSFKRQTSAGSGASVKMDDAPKPVEDEKEKEVSMGRVMKMNSPEWIFIVLGCLSALVHGGAMPLFGLVFGGFMGIYTLLCEPEKMMSEIIFYALMFIVIGAGIGISMFCQFWMFGISGEALTLRFRQMTFRALLHQEMAYFDDPRNSVGAMASRLATDASAVQGATGVRLGMMLQALSCIVVGLVIGFFFSWKFTLFIIGVVPFLMMAAVVQMKLAKGFSGKHNKLLEDAAKLANEGLNNIRTVSSLTKEKQFIEDYEKLNYPIYRQNMKSAQIFGVVFAILQAMLYFAYAAIFYFGGWLIAYDDLKFDSMFKCYVAIIFGAISIGRESGFAPDYGKAKISAARIFALLDRKPTANDSSSKEGLKPTVCSGTVELRDIHFSYPMRPTIPVLRGINLKVEQGDTIALVGSSGCGKSTSVALIERFYDIQEGHVLIDGNDIKALNVSWLRSQLGLVSQEPTLFGYSIRENIAYGDNSRSVTMDEIIEAARQANIHKFIETLPQGYETNVGDRGTQLSGGQKQRIAIARALVRNPKILLLDEATSALDTESEKVVQEALDQARQGRTCLTIAHRLSTIQNASCIVVFQHGRVLEQGTHSELLTRKGLYYKLVMTQGHKK